VVSRSKRSREGEILIDHRASPGLTPEMIGRFGIAVAGGEIFESAIYTCSHCQCGVVLNPDRSRERHWCAKCDRYICDECAYRMARTLECRNVQRRMDQMAEAIERGGVSPLLLMDR
jgi:hypothetical protein